MKYAVIVQQPKKFNKVEIYENKIVAIHRYQNYCSKNCGSIILAKIKKEYKEK